METEHEDLLEALSEILGMEPAMLRRAVEAARARNDEAGLSALMMRAADAKMAAGLTDNIRRTVRGEQAGAFSVAICMEWNALYEQALTATETALSEVTHQRDVFRSCLRRAAESVSAHPLSGSESADALVDMVQRALAEERQKREEADEALRATYRHCYDRDPVRIDAEAQGESIREYVNACHEDDARLTRELASECARADRAEAMLSEWDALAEALDGRKKAGAMRTERDEARHALDECRAGMWEANERAEQWNALWHRDVAAAIEAESIASLAMSEGLRAVEQEAAEADALSDALDARTQRCDREMRELAEATGVAWRGHTHEEVVAMVRSKRERAEKVVEAARVASDWGNGGVEHGARCAAYNGQIGGSPYICKCGMDMLRAALAAYEEGQLAAQTPVIAAIEQGRCESLPEFVAYARRKALREAAGVPSKVIADLRRRGLLTAGDESVARSIESGILALIGASESESGPPRRAETIFGCRTCGASTKGWSDGRFAATGWRRLDRIDGPNAICPACVADPTALDVLREEFPNVTLASESGERKPKRYVAVSKDGSVMRYFDSLDDAAEGGRREFGARFLGAREARESDKELSDGLP